MSKIGNSNSFTGKHYSSQTQRELTSSASKLSSGKRITSASDDAAGLGVSSKLKASSKSKGQAIRNANDAVSVIQTLQGGLNGFASLITRLRELAIQSSSGTYNNHERSMMDTEVQQTLKQIDQIAQSQEIFGQKISVGNRRKLNIQVDSHNRKGDRIQIDLENLSHTTNALGLIGIDVKSQRHARFSLPKIDFALREVNKSLARLGGYSSRLESAIKNLQNSVHNTRAANSRIEDADYAKETARNVSSNLQKNVQTSVASQVSNGFANILNLIE